MIFSSLAILVVVVAVFMAAFYFGSAWFASAGLWLKEHFGMAGIGAFVFFVDCLPNFFSSDVVFAFTQDWNIPLLLTVMSVASILGGMGGYYIARYLGKTKPVKRFIDKNLKKGKALLQKHGTWAIILAALTPIPYAHTCWIAGVLHVDPKKVLVGSLFRAPRMVLYFWAIKAGIVLVTGGS